MPPQPKLLRSLGPAAFCAVALALCVWAAHPVLEMGSNDDWSYIYSARVLAETGRVVYNGWATAMLGWQLYLGALFIKLFGFSFTVTRFPILLVSMGSVFLLQRTLVRFGISSWNATLGTLTLALSPVFLALSYTFMTDVPGFFCAILCTYMCVRAVQAETDRATVLWIVAASLLNALGGTVRQIAWLGALVQVPATIWYLRSRRGVLRAGVVATFVSIVFIAGCMRWFKTQPYALEETLITIERNWHGISKLPNMFSRNILSLLVFLFPVLAAFVWKYPLRSGRARTLALVVAGVLTAGVVACLAFDATSYLGLSRGIGYYVGPKGVPDIPAALGPRPDLLTPFTRTLITAVVLLALAALLYFLRYPPPPRKTAISSPYSLSNEALAWVLGPFTAASLCMIVTRGIIFDRYLLTLMAIGLIFLLRFYEQRIDDRLPLITPVLIAAIALFSVGAIHDSFAMNRARLAAAEELRQAGVPRSDIRAGMEYDAWTEIERTGYVNDWRLHRPAGAFHPFTPPAIPPACRPFFMEHTPSFTGRYVLAFEPLPCYTLSQFPAVAYRTWFPPRQHQIVIQNYP